MREILFRGKTEDGKWEYGYPYEIYRNCHTRKVIARPPDAFGKGKYTEIIDETLSQFTGLTDKNGTKIFEGDILKDNWGKIYKVIFSTQSCSFMVECTKAPNEYEIGRYRIGKAWCDTIEVIGNIHDNPDLIGGVADAT
ncbi:MAG: hypothetical protein IJN27_01760 [Oscillospiraceae bacterium]|nr:hypothetical protein [Oscillospiraceae bacterium]